MRALRLHRELYESKAVDEAQKILGAYAELKREDDASHFVVSITGQSPARERKVALELANHALTLSRR